MGDTHHTVKYRVKEHVFWGFRLILFLYIGCFLQNQPENVLSIVSKNLTLHKLPTDEMCMSACCVCSKQRM